MATVSETPELERLFAAGRERALLRADGRERLVEGGMAVSFLVVAVAMALLIESPRSLDGPTLAVLVGAYVIACRAQFEIADGYTVPTELILVPMLFLLPTPVVPLVVSGSWMLGRLIDYAAGRTSIHRAYHVFGDCWHAVGPALVLILAGAQVFSWAEWPIYAARPRRPVRLRLRRDLAPRPADRRRLAAREPAPARPGLRPRRGARPGRPASRRSPRSSSARRSACW